MDKRTSLSRRIEEQRKKQETTDNLALALSALMGANVVRKTDFDEVNREKQELLNQVKDIEELRIQLIYSECKVQAFARYHSQWKPTTRNIVRKLSKLKKRKTLPRF